MKVFLSLVLLVPLFLLTFWTSNKAIAQETPPCTANIVSLNGLEATFRISNLKNATSEYSLETDSTAIQTKTVANGSNYIDFTLTFPDGTKLEEEKIYAAIGAGANLRTPDYSCTNATINLQGNFESVNTVTGPNAIPDLAAPTTDPGGGTTAPSACDTKGSAEYGTTTCKKQRCDGQKSDGKVFTPAFNSACVALPEFLQTLLNYFMLFASIIAGIMLLRGGFGILTSRGTPASVSDAQSMLTNAVVGLVLVALAFVLIQFLNGAFRTVDPTINLLGPFIQGK